MTVRFRTFRKHRRPCGQPTVVGGIERFRPVPSHAGHFTRKNATPSDLPFKSTGFAINPVPPQFGHSSDLTPLPPHWLMALSPRAERIFRQSVSRYESRTKTAGWPGSRSGNGTESHAHERVSTSRPANSSGESLASRDGARVTTTAFDVGVLLLNATLPIGTSTLASGK